MQKQFRVGESKYRVHYINEDRRPKLGRINYGLKSIEVFTQQRTEHSIKETVLHELVHAVLHEMGHKLYNNEKFVTQFAKLLNNALHDEEQADDR
jgi:ssRNA-specific RNase YbeY (16S rRNA maturation enzyme)